jgi:hypothetical protein
MQFNIFKSKLNLHKCITQDLLVNSHSYDRYEVMLQEEISYASSSLPVALQNFDTSGNNSNS